MSASLIPQIRFRFFDNNGNPLAGGLVYSYVSGTSTPAVTYSDEAGTVLNTNPVVLDSAGYAPIYLSDIFAYRIVVKTSAGVTLQTVDDVVGTNASQNSTIIENESRTATAGQVIVTFVNNFSLAGDNSELFVNGASQILNIDYTILTANSVQFSAALHAGDVVQLRVFDAVVYTPTAPPSTITTETVTAIQGQTLVPLVNAYTIGGHALEVCLNGAVQVVGQDYNETSTNSITFNTALNAGDVVYARAYSVAIITDSDADLVSYNQGGLGSVTTNVGAKLQETVSVKDFGAVGDDIADDTQAIQNAVNYVLLAGGILHFPTGIYKVTDTISLTNSASNKMLSLMGENTMSTMLKFYNSTVDKNFFFVGSDVNYLTIQNLEFADNTHHTSRGFYFQDTSASSAPSWKHTFEKCRITNFHEGIRWDGGATPAQDTHESEVLYLHSKFRNNTTGVIFNNIQAVNHQFIATDFENDDILDATEKWTHIYLLRGTTINHFGGSVIGYGAYVRYLFPADGTAFQQGNQFKSYGIRMEARGDGPFISHDQSSNLNFSTFYRLHFRDLTVVNSVGITPVLSEVGGRSVMTFENCMANTQMLVNAYMTSNLSANANYGTVKIIDCQSLKYNRVSSVAAYGGTAVAASNLRAIPAAISMVSDGVVGANDTAGYYDLVAETSDYYAGGVQLSSPKVWSYTNADTSGFGSGANPSVLKAVMPLWARPYKLRLLRSPVNVSAAFTFTLRWVNNSPTAISGCANNGAGLIRVSTSSAHGMSTGDGVTISGISGTTEANGDWTVTVITTTSFDLQSSTFANAYVSGGTFTIDRTVGTITMGANVLGAAEALLSNASGSVQYFNDGVTWDGKFKLIKSGTTSGFIGQMQIEYL